MAGTLTNNQKSQEFYRLAYKCIEQQSTGQCDNKCVVCALNINLYVDDPRDATLIKTSAQIDYTNLQYYKKQDASEQCLQTISHFICIILFLVLPIWFCVSKIKSCTTASAAQDPKYEQHNLLPYTPLTDAELDAMFDSLDEKFKASKAKIQHGESPSLIAARKVAATIYDVNKDKQINCVDKALLFRQYYGDGTQARLIWNKHGSMNHMFVYVPDGQGGWIAIEPAETATALNKRLMTTYWDNYYPKYDRDITMYEQQLRNNTFKWIWN